MIKALLSTISIFLLAIIGFSQVPVATISNDQIVQGPCYIFATVAAIESKAKQNISGLPPSFDIYEWNLYSKSVLGSRTGDGHNMVKKVIAHAKSKGVYDKSTNFIPTMVSVLPNSNDPVVPGIADFTGCINNFSSGSIAYSYVGNSEGNCLDDDDKEFMVQPIQGTEYTYNYSGTGYVLDSTPNALEMKGHLNAGRGLIAFFDNWDGNGTSHAVFIYGYSKFTWKYKDSWPGNPGIKDTVLNISDCSSFYYLTGNVTTDACSGTISGNTTVTGNTTYTLSNNGSSISNINWSIPSNLTIVSQSGTSIIVRPNTCGSTSGNISATFTSNSQTCSAIKSITISSSLTLTLTPTSISVQSYNWNNGVTCSNTILELEAIDNNTGYPTTSYNWSISGATLLSGQGTPTVFVRTSNSPGTTYLTFKVRAKNGTCSYSGWRTIYGQSSSSNCGGGGALRIAKSTQNKYLSVQNFEELDLQHNELQYRIITMDGKTQKIGCIDHNSNNIDISGIPDKLIILVVYSEDGQYYQSSRHIINEY